MLWTGNYDGGDDSNDDIMMMTMMTITMMMIMIGDHDEAKAERRARLALLAPIRHTHANVLWKESIKLPSHTSTHSAHTELNVVFQRTHTDRDLRIHIYDEYYENYSVRDWLDLLDYLGEDMLFFFLEEYSQPEFELKNDSFIL